MESSLVKNVAIRGWHVYGKTSWKSPKKGQKVFAEKETDMAALVADPFAVAWKLKVAGKLTAEIVGHVPSKISRATSFFLDRGGVLEGYVLDEKYQPSPIPRGGLEIVLTAVFKITDEKRRYLERLKNIISENYSEEMGAHAGGWIAGDSISMFDREMGENEAEEELDREIDDGDTMIIIMEDEGAVDFDGKLKDREIICIED